MEKSKPFACNLCGYEFKGAADLKRHRADVHDIDVVWHYCDLCDHKCKQKGNLKTHRASAHDIGVTWHPCDLCDREFKRSGDLKRHRADTHEINVVWHACEFTMCDYRAKQKSNLNIHWNRCHSARAVQRHKRAEMKVEKALLAAGYTMCDFKGDLAPPAGHFRREVHIDFRCVGDMQSKFARLDFVVGVEEGLVFLEVDENQHRFGYDADQSCDNKRMAKVGESLTIGATKASCIPPRMRWIRYNPHARRIDGVLRKTPTKQRLKRLVEVIEGGTEFVEYLYYDEEEGVPTPLLRESYVAMV